MAIRIGIDIGGTFTDVALIKDGTLVRGKAETTSYNLKVGLLAAIRVAAEKLGLTPEDALRAADSVVYSTTIGTNALIQRRGARLGLITTMGFEDTVQIGRARNWGDGLPPEVKYDRGRARRPVPLIPRELIVGVRERVDHFGAVLTPLHPDEAREKIQTLVDRGVRGFVVCLLCSYINPVHENLIREIIREEYLEPSLGHLPVFLSHEVSPQIGEYRRTLTTFLDAYLRVETEEHLLELTDDLRDAAYRRPLFVAKNTGGVSSLSRSRPLHLMGSSPVAGIMGAGWLGRGAGVKNILVTDTGGTSFDLGIIAEGKERVYEADPIIDRWRVQLPLIAHWSIGAGGGSIAWVEEGLLHVGPRSAGALPGPACYDRGGKEPTVTDADLVLGYIDPDYFLGGRITLDRNRALRAIREQVAEPLGIDPLVAAAQIRRLIDGVMGQEIYRRTTLVAGLDPREFTLFALGGAGPVHAASVAQSADVSRIMVFPFGSVFGAFGTSTMDLLQTYEKSLRVILFSQATQSYEPGAVEILNGGVAELLQSARRDMEEEGFDMSAIHFEVEVQMRYGQQRHTLAVKLPGLALIGTADVVTLCDEFTRQYIASYGQGAAFPGAGIEAIGLRLHAVGAMAKPELASHPTRGPDPEGARKGERRVFWGEVKGLVPTPVYQMERLAAGNRVVGPGLIESEDTVCVVPQGWVFTLDPYLHGHLDLQP
jgi:N-methylhydantoinase A/acetophenone carboxylase